MDINDLFPLKYYLNTGRADIHRNEMQYQLAVSGLEARRFASVNPEFVRRYPGYRDRGSYAHALSHRLALRSAREQGAAAVLLLGDDLAFSKKLSESISDLKLPDDWGILYLGCTHFEAPEAVSRHLLRVTGAIPAHAIAVRRPHFAKVSRALRSRHHIKPSVSIFDAYVALQKEIPTYAVYPDLLGPRSKEANPAFTAIPGSDASFANDLGRTIARQTCLFSEEGTGRDDQSEKLSISSRFSTLPGWKNHDLGSGSAMAASIRLPFDEGSFDTIYSSNQLELLSRSGGEQFLSEIFRILKPGGRLRILTEDIAAMLGLLASPTPSLAEAYLQATEPASAGKVPHRPLPELFHSFVNAPAGRYIHDPASLHDLLSRTGFTGATAVAVNESRCDHFRGIENWSEVPVELLKLVSQTWEAFKPET